MDTPPRIKVVQLATGVIGRHCLRQTILDRRFELVGVSVFSPEKDGVDAGSIVGLPETGVFATTDLDRIVGMDAEVAIHCVRLDPNPAVLDEPVLRLLRSGTNVISTVGYIHPGAFGQDYLQQFNDACTVGGTTLFGTGINPGLLLERVVPTFAATTMHIDRIEADEYFDLSQVPSAGTVCLMLGIGGDPAALTPDGIVAQGLTRLFEPSLRLVGRQLGFEFDRIELEQRPTLAEEDETVEATTIKQGTVGAIRFRWRCYSNEQLRLQFTLNHRGVSHLGGDWDFSDHWRVRVFGAPSVDVTYQLISQSGESPLDAAALHTAAMVMRSIPEVVDAPPGVLQVPIFTAESAPQRVVPVLVRTTTS
jgi:hypothetical protein